LFNSVISSVEIPGDSPIEGKWDERITSHKTTGRGKKSPSPSRGHKKSTALI
jgi:hypothetical protein